MCLCCKQKTAYEMRISDWSSDVCSSDLGIDVGLVSQRLHQPSHLAGVWAVLEPPHEFNNAACPLLILGCEGCRERISVLVGLPAVIGEIGRASCRARVCQYV